MIRYRKVKETYMKGSFIGIDAHEATETHYIAEVASRWTRSYEGEWRTVATIRPDSWSDGSRRWAVTYHTPGRDTEYPDTLDEAKERVESAIIARVFGD